MFQISLDLLEDPAGHAGRYSLPLLPRSDSLHVHPEELTENWLTDPQRRTHILDLFGLEGAGVSLSLILRTVYRCSTGTPDSSVSRNRSSAATILAPFAVSFPWPLIRLSAA